MEMGSNTWGNINAKSLFLGTHRAGSGWVTEESQLKAIWATEEGASNLWEPSQLWYDDQLVQQKQDEGYEIVLTGDFNEDFKHPRSNMRRLALELGLKESFFEQNTEKTRPLTHTFEEGLHWMGCSFQTTSKLYKD